MDVVAAVARDAFASDRRNLLAGQPVAGAAGERPVRPVQREARPAVVVEVPASASRARCGTAAQSEPSVSLCLSSFSWQRRAVGPGVLVRGRQVALPALDARMAPDQLEARLVVVEAHRLLPVGRLVALLALPAELVAMLVVLPVARVAVGPELVPVGVAGVAAVALGRPRACRAAGTSCRARAGRRCRARTCRCGSCRTCRRSASCACRPCGGRRCRRSAVPLKLFGSRWQSLHSTSLCLPRSLKTDRSWSYRASRQLRSVWQSPHAVPSVALCLSSFWWQPMQVVGVFAWPGVDGVAGLALRRRDACRAGRTWCRGRARKAAVSFQSRRGVAGLALVAQPAPVLLVVLAMAADAGQRRALEHVVRVAALARRRNVLAGQREPRSSRGRSGCPSSWPRCGTPRSAAPSAPRCLSSLRWQSLQSLGRLAVLLAGARGRCGTRP